MKLAAFTLSAAVTLGLLAGAARGARADAPSAPVLRALAEELQRSMKDLALPGEPKPYFIAYRVTDAQSAHASATFGALVERGRQHTRELSVEVRVGDPSFDSSNYTSGFEFGGVHESLPLDDDPAVIRHEAWLATDRAYKKALEHLEAKKATRKAQAAPTDDAGSFSSEPAIVNDAAVPPTIPDDAAFPGVVRTLSRVFREFPAVQADSVSLRATATWTAFLSSEGARITRADSEVGLHVGCSAQADDGMVLSHGLERRAHDLAGLPKEETLVKDVREVAADLTLARGAPVVEDTTAPVLFDGLAAPEIIRALLADELGGTPPAENAARAHFGGGTDTGLRSKLGQRLLPAGFRVVDDPTTATFGRVPLYGAYAFDDEGVAAQKVVLVEDGLLRTLLMSRAPIKEIPHSNGHGFLGFYDTARGQAANLVVTATRGVRHGDLKVKLLAEMRAEGAAHGYIVRSFMGRSEFPDFMRASRGVRPLFLTEVGKGGEERVVRGGSFEALALRSLKDIVATGQDLTVSTGPFALHLGGATATIAAPSLLFKEVELKKRSGPEPTLTVAKHPFFAEK